MSLLSMTVFNGYVNARQIEGVMDDLRLHLANKTFLMTVFSVRDHCRVEIFREARLAKVPASENPSDAGLKYTKASSASCRLEMSFAYVDEVGHTKKEQVTLLSRDEQVCQLKEDLILSRRQEKGQYELDLARPSVTIDLSRGKFEFRCFYDGVQQIVTIMIDR